jgi:soluble lytic murein transglycosylase-like protein
MSMQPARIVGGVGPVRTLQPSRHPRCFLVTVALTVAASLGCASPAASQALGSPPASLSSEIAGHDPYAAHISEAALRFGIPEAWIRAVMRVESAGNASATSHAGAMGLMQVMPGTYAELRARYGLGPNPYDPRNSILAGTAYLREMHDRYGSTGFLAAYNAGPGRWEDYAYRGRRLPAETVAYMARLEPMLRASAAPSPPIVSHVNVVSWTRSALFAGPRPDEPTADPPSRELLIDGTGSAADEPAPSAAAGQKQTVATARPHPLFAVRRPQ